MTLTNTTRICIASAVSVVVTTALIVYVGNSLRNKGIALTENMQIVVDEQVREQKYYELETLVAETETERAELDTLILNGEDDTVRFLSEIDMLAQSIGVQLITEKLEVHEVKESPYKALDIVLALDASDARITEFLALLESLPYHGYLSAVRLTQSLEGTTTEGMITLTMSLRE